MDVRTIVGADMRCISLVGGSQGHLIPSICRCGGDDFCIECHGTGRLVSVVPGAVLVAVEGGECVLDVLRLYAQRDGEGYYMWGPALLASRSHLGRLFAGGHHRLSLTPARFEFVLSQLAAVARRATAAEVPIRLP